MYTNDAENYNSGTHHLLVIGAVLGSLPGASRLSPCIQTHNFKPEETAADASWQLIKHILDRYIC